MYLKKNVVAWNSTYIKNRIQWMERPSSQPSYNIFTIREEEFGKKFKCINGIINGKKNGIS